MKILFTVEFYEPHKGGAEEVVKQLAERLAKLGHQVTVATSKINERKEKLINGVHIEEFVIFGKAVRGITGQSSEKQRYQQFVCGDWDIVLNYAAENWATDLCFDVLDEIRGRKVLIPCGYSLKKPAYRPYYEKLPKFLKKYDALVYMSTNYQDKKFGDEHGLSGKAVIIPNGSPEIFSTVNIKEKLGIKTKYLALTVANHYRAKGHDFVIKAFRQMERKDATLLIVGNVPAYGLKHLEHLVLGCYPRCLASSWLNKNIELLPGDDRSLVLSAYKSSDLFLFGSSFEYAPLVMYESFAAKALFITREVGMVRDHENLLRIVKAPQDMAKTANFYLDHPNERGKIIDLAFSEWQEKYDWTKIVKQYEELFNKLITNNR